MQLIIIGENRFSPENHIMMRNIFAGKSHYGAQCNKSPFIVVRKNRVDAYILRDEIGQLKRAVLPDYLKQITLKPDKTKIDGGRHHKHCKTLKQTSRNCSCYMRLSISESQVIKYQFMIWLRYCCL